MPKFLKNSSQRDDIQTTIEDLLFLKSSFKEKIRDLVVKKTLERYDSDREFSQFLSKRIDMYQLDFDTIVTTIDCLKRLQQEGL